MKHPFSFRGRIGPGWVQLRGTTTTMLASTQERSVRNGAVEPLNCLRSAEDIPCPVPGNRSAASLPDSGLASAGIGIQPGNDSVQGVVVGRIDLGHQRIMARNNMIGAVGKTRNAIVSRQHVSDGKDDRERR